MSRHQSRRRGLTQIEVLTLLVVVACVMRIVLPAIQASREAARRANCRNNLKQIALALHNYHDVYAAFPPGCYPAHPDDATGADSWAWSVLIFPFLE